MTSYKSLNKNIEHPTVFQITDKKINFNFSKNTVYVLTSDEFTMNNVIITNNQEVQLSKKKNIFIEESDFYEGFSTDDIIQVLPEGKVNVLWEKKLNPHDIVLFITNNCNAKCIMCPQPPGKDPFDFLETNTILLEYLKNQPIKKIGITGGEPTLKHKELRTLLELAYKNFPNAKVDLLTNAKKLSNFQQCKELCLSNPNITFCISFPSDNENDFNRILVAKIFTDVISAIQNLAKLRQDIELRIVVTKLNYKRLSKISEFIYRNFPFVAHITFMGMEVVGYAYDNFDQIEIYPNQYNDELYKAVQYLNHRNMNVSIYNLPYCLIDQKLWKFLRNSISTWKQSYDVECNICTKKDTCPGVFSTNKLKNYSVKPIY
jgi:His-Xaa-Ser system radical SAM maturase HxsC